MITDLIQDSQLYLPCLQRRERLNFNLVRLAPEGISAPVSDEFVRVWQRGPTNPTVVELGRCMGIICTALAELVVAGKGRVKSFAKLSPADLVTEVDRGIEMLLRLWIKRFYPEHKIIGEEGFKDTIFPDDYVWYIDPVDGTTNFVDGNDRVSMHVGCFYQGNPVWSFLGLPFRDIFYAHSGRETIRWTVSTLHSPEVLTPFSIPMIGLGTEYMSSRKAEDRHFYALAETLGMKAVRTKSIGVTLSEFLTGQLTAFYKPKAKLWDVMAPLGVIKGLLGPELTVEIMIHRRQDGARMFFPLFSADSELYAHLNDCHLTHCRAGLVLAYPTEAPHIKTEILKFFKK